MQTQSVISPLADYINNQDAEKVKQVADLSWQILEETIAELSPGITESEAVKCYKALCQKQGITEQWHRPYIYFGDNTLLTYRDLPSKENTLQETDIVYLDLAPIIDGIEGDVGKTVVFGNNPDLQNLQSTSESIFNICHTYWQQTQCTGIALYEKMITLTQEHDCLYILDGPGHLVGDLPHARWKGGLETYPYPVESGAWILEVHIRHKTQPYGAFFERLLV